ncbi:MAG: ScyD/ScyE family protein [Sphingomicrobium sp.]
MSRSQRVCAFKSTSLTLRPASSLYRAPVKSDACGRGGSNSTVGQCTQVPAPVGPYTGAQTGGRISKVVNGSRVTVNDKFATSETAPTLGNLVSGVADIAWIGSTMYAITAGGGCSHGVLGKPNGVYRVQGNNTPTLVANLSAFQMVNPVANPEPDDFEPDGTWYGMVALRGDLYAVEPNHGELDRITTAGSITRVADISATLGHIVPTAVDVHGNFYVGNLNTFPIQTGSSKILKITPSGYVTPVAWGLTTVLGVAFDKRDRMYVLENTVGQPFPTPGYGDVVRIDPNGKQTVVVHNLPLPTGMTFGSDGALYISVLGFGPPVTGDDGPGQVWRFTGL